MKIEGNFFYNALSYSVRNKPEGKSRQYFPSTLAFCQATCQINILKKSDIKLRVFANALFPCTAFSGLSLSSTNLSNAIRSAYAFFTTKKRVQVIYHLTQTSEKKKNFSRFPRFSLRLIQKFMIIYHSQANKRQLFC